jgi:hypothetical protein
MSFMRRPAAFNPSSWTPPSSLTLPSRQARLIFALAKPAKLGTSRKG